MIYLICDQSYSDLGYKGHFSWSQYWISKRFFSVFKKIGYEGQKCLIPDWSSYIPGSLQLRTKFHLWVCWILSFQWVCIAAIWTLHFTCAPPCHLTTDSSSADPVITTPIYGTWVNCCVFWRRWWPEGIARSRVPLLVWPNVYGSSNSAIAWRPFHQGGRCQTWLAMAN